MNPITVSVLVNAPIETVWESYTQPEHITQWNFASGDWHCPEAHNDLRVGGRFGSTMAAKDGSFSFNFEGTYTDVQPHQRLAYNFGDRKAEVLFELLSPEQTKVTVTFDPESTNPEEMQRAGWQAILHNFRQHTEGL